MLADIEALASCAAVPVEASAEPEAVPRAAGRFAGGDALVMVSATPWARSHSFQFERPTALELRGRCASPVCCFRPH